MLLATGGFSRDLTGNALPLTVYGRTVTLFEVSEAEAARLTGMPALIYLDPPENHPYLLPAIRYPDGKYYLKMGGPSDDPVLETEAQITDWFRSSGDAAAGTRIEAMLRARMPDLQILSTSTLPCVTTYTPDERPALTTLSPRVFTAIGGCGTDPAPLWFSKISRVNATFPECRRGQRPHSGLWPENKKGPLRPSSY